MSCYHHTNVYIAFWQVSAKIKKMNIYMNNDISKQGQVYKKINDYFLKNFNRVASLDECKEIEKSLRKSISKSTPKSNLEIQKKRSKESEDFYGKYFIPEVFAQSYPKILKYNTEECITFKIYKGVDKKELLNLVKGLNDLDLSYPKKFYEQFLKELTIQGYKPREVYKTYNYLNLKYETIKKKMYRYKDLPKFEKKLKKSLFQEI